MASVSLQGGDQWTEELKRNIRASSCLLFLATKAARLSHWANQELGGAVIANKRVIPVLWEIAQSELPGFAAHIQTLTLSGISEREIRDLSSKVAEIVREERAKGPPEVAALLEQAIKRIEAQAYESAIEILTQAVKLAPLAGSTNYFLAVALLKCQLPLSLFLS
jgi:hypothetical protein